MDDARFAYLTALAAATGGERFSMPEIQTGEALVEPVPGVARRLVLRELYGQNVTADALRWGDAEAAVEAVKWRGWRPPFLPFPDALWDRKKRAAKERKEPLWIPSPRPEPVALPPAILTKGGWISLEDEYVPRVCAGEVPRSTHPEAKAALAIAARTFVVRAMRDHPTLGMSTPVPSGPQFQVMARSAGAGCREAAARTRGKVLLYRGRLILANHVAGAPWGPDGLPGKDPTETERFVTYNDGLRGSAVVPTNLALRAHPGNRGCMSQNGAEWLAVHGFDYGSILRFFYGADVEIEALGETARRTSPPSPFSGALGSIVMTGIGLLIREALR